MYKIISEYLYKKLLIFNHTEYVLRKLNNVSG